MDRKLTAEDATKGLEDMIKKLDHQHRPNAIDGVWIMDGMSTAFGDQKSEEHEGASGQLIYDKKLKTVFAHIVRPDDKSATGELRFEYAGTFALSPDNDNEITHNIAWATNPKMIGMAMKREFDLNSAGNRLSITGPSAEYKDAKIKISWKKLEL